MASKEKPINLASYHSKLVGVVFEGRQDIIKTLKGDEPLRFRREFENEWDKNAVAVDVLANEDILGGYDSFVDHDTWLPIGYIARDKNAELAEVLMDGRFASIKISDITGGDEGKNWGVNVKIEYERKVKLSRSENAVLLKDFFGNEIFYDDVKHEYTNALGEVYLSGSQYDKEEPFDSDKWSTEFVNKYDLEKEDKQRILDMWEVNSKASCSFGTAIHSAVELYGKYHRLADIIDVDLKTGKRKKLDAKTEKNSALSKLPLLKAVVKAFFTPERLEENAFYEVLVVDHKNKRAGQIDRLLILDDGTYEVRDVKTNARIMKKERDSYTKQLSVYGDILIANGCKLGPNPVMLHHLNGVEWVDIKLDKIDTLK
jgi:hypothetical protein